VRPPIQRRRLGVEAEVDGVTSKAETGGTWCRIPGVAEGGWGGAMLEDDEELELLL
jgi:hypothetical protein